MDRGPAYNVGYLLLRGGEMRQIPSDDTKRCAGCPCYREADRGGYCRLWPDGVNRIYRKERCFGYKPQVLTEEDRGEIFHAGMRAGYENAQELAEEAKRGQD